MRKPVFGVSDLVRHKPGCAVTADGQGLEISDLESGGIVVSVYIAKTKALISFAVTAKLICGVLVFVIQKAGFLTKRLKCSSLYSIIISKIFCSVFLYFWTQCRLYILNDTSNVTDSVFGIFQKRLEQLNRTFHHRFRI